jgi:hypothetical protein
MLLWKCNMVHRSCYQGKPDMSQYIIDTRHDPSKLTGLNLSCVEQ